MAGALIHILVAVLSAFMVHFMHFRTEFSIAVFIGAILPDALKFGISAIAQSTIYLFSIEKSVLYQAIDRVTSDFGYWISMLIFVVAVTGQLYHHKVIRKKEMKEINEIYGFLVLGIIIHLVLDILIIEQSVWM